MGHDRDNPGKGDTVRLARPGSKVALDDRGHTVWVGDVQTGHFELVSTQTMEALIRSGDPNLRAEWERLADDGEDGVLALDRATGHYRVLEPESLDALMNRPVEGREPLPSGGRNIDQLEPDAPATDDEELQLVSTQMLRQILGKDVAEADRQDDGQDEAAFCNPYDSRPAKKR